MRNLRMDGIQKIFLGMTDLFQVNKVSASAECETW